MMAAQIFVWIQYEKRTFFCCEPTATDAQANAEEKMHDQLHDQTMQPYNNGEFRVSDVVINNNQNQEFHPMRNE